MSYGSPRFGDWRAAFSIGLLATAIVLLGALPVWGATPLAYLVNQQNLDGSWGDPIGSQFRDTTVILDALEDFDPGSAAGALGLAWLQSATARNQDDRSRKIISLAASGVDVSALVGSLLAGQRAEIFDSLDPDHPGRGWGIEPEFAVDILDTALAIRALESAGTSGGLAVVDEEIAVGATSPPHPVGVPIGASGNRVLVRATTGNMRLLVTVPNIGTLFIDLNPATVPVIVGMPVESGTHQFFVENLDAAAISVQYEFGFTDPVGFDVFRITTPLVYLAKSQNADGGWGISGGEASNLMITSEVVRTLASVGDGFFSPSAVGDGAAFLRALQNPDGGFSSTVGSSSVSESILAMAALRTLDPEDPALASGSSYLASQQLPDGSLDGLPFATAMGLPFVSGAPAAVPALTDAMMLALVACMLIAAIPFLRQSYPEAR